MYFKKVSILLQILIVFSCLLPFYPTSCSEKLKEYNHADSIAMNDTFAIDSSQDISLESTTTYADSLKTDTGNDIKYTDELAAKNRFYKTILRPKNNYSMIGYILDNLESLYYSLAAFFLFMLVIVGVLKVFNFWSLSIIINIFCFIGMLFYNPMFLFGKKLWGSHIMLLLLFVTSVFDFFFWRKSKSNSPLNK